MPDISVQLRDYIESVAPAVEEEEVRSHPLVRVPAPTLGTGARRPLGFGLVTAVLVVAIASVALLLDSPLGGPDLRSVPLSSVDVCDLLIDATRRAGQARGSMMTHRHEPTPWEADVCAHDGWDFGWHSRHLILRLRPTSTDEAQQVLTRHDLLWIPMEWEVERPGVWIATRGVGETEFYAVAVSAAPYFFIVTYADREDALAVADAVLVELGIEKGDQ